MKDLEVSWELTVQHTDPNSHRFTNLTYLRNSMESKCCLFLQNVEYSLSTY